MDWVNAANAHRTSKAIDFYLVPVFTLDPDVVSDKTPDLYQQLIFL